MTKLFQILLNNNAEFRYAIESNIYLFIDIKNCFINKSIVNNSCLLAFYFHNSHPKYYTFHSTIIDIDGTYSILEDIKIYNRYLNIQKL